MLDFFFSAPIRGQLPKPYCEYKNTQRAHQFFFFFLNPSPRSRNCNRTFPKLVKACVCVHAAPFSMQWASLCLTSKKEMNEFLFVFQLESWPDFIRSRFNYTVYSISFPSENAAEWKKLFKPCASQRLFLPLILKDVDSIVYVDSDILFLQPVDQLWGFLSQFNSSQLAAMAPEHEEPRIAWYNRFARHPFYGRTGINSGVMLMNMTRMRSTFFKNDMTSVGLRWEELLMPLLQKYKLNITWGDQDLLNIIFHYNPESLLEFPCQWNYRPDHCIYGSNCASAEEDGIYILHGNRGVYHDYKQPAFRAVYEAIKKVGMFAGESLFYPLCRLPRDTQTDLLNVRSTSVTNENVKFHLTDVQLKWSHAGALVVIQPNIDGRRGRREATQYCRSPFFLT
uniref:Glucoside xylosyltransferase 1 n=1 Tax=Stegastes partitus TaxID=144197 RepID=A0A3B5AJD7_9TELE